MKRMHSCGSRVPPKSRPEKAPSIGRSKPLGFPLIHRAFHSSPMPFEKTRSSSWYASVRKEVWSKFCGGYQAISRKKKLQNRTASSAMSINNTLRSKELLVEIMYLLGVQLGLVVLILKSMPVYRKAGSCMK